LGCELSLGNAETSQTYHQVLEEGGETLMSWKNLLLCGGLVCVLTSRAAAQPEITVTSSYNTTLDVIEWVLSITPSDGYTGALAIEAPFILDGFGSFNPTLRANGSTSQTTHSAGDNNGTGAQSWYYNVDTNGTTLLWNTKGSSADIEQNTGANPFSGTETDGLWMDTATNSLFASLGSDVNMPVPVKTIHFASNDGNVYWDDLMVEETGDPGSTELLTGAATSVKRVDMDGNGVISGLDIQPLIDVLNGLLVTNYNPVYPGLDGIARADADNNGVVSGLDIQPSIDCLNAIACPMTTIPAAPAFPGAGSGAGVATAGVPEPASAILFLLGALAMGAVRRNRR
jgi:hypothetical protein